MVNVYVLIETHDPLTAVARLFEPAARVGGRYHKLSPGSKSLRRPSQCQPTTSIDLTEQKELNRASGGLGTGQPGRYDPAAVDDYCVAGVKVLCNAGEDSVLDSAGSPIDHHQPGPLAYLGRLLRDKVGWQIEVEIGDTESHAPFPAILFRT